MTLSQSLTRHAPLTEAQERARRAPKGQRRKARRELEAVLHGALRRAVEGAQ